MNDYPILPLDAAAMDRFNTELLTGEELVTEPNQVLMLLVANRLQIRGRTGKWYDVRKNGAIKNFPRKRRVEAPCKLGLRECFRIVWTNGGAPMVDYAEAYLRARPLWFNPRDRTK